MSGQGAVTIGPNLGASASDLKTDVDFAPTKMFVEMFGTEEASKQLEDFARETSTRHVRLPTETKGTPAAEPEMMTQDKADAIRAKLPPLDPLGALLVGVGVCFLVGLATGYLLARK